MTEVAVPRHFTWRRNLAIAGLLFAAFATYRVFGVYTVRTGTCDFPITPAEPVRTGAPRFPARQQAAPKARSIVVMSYNTEGHAALLRQDHLEKLAEVIRATRADIIGLQEVHRGTWQAHFRDQAAELARLTGMNSHFGPSFRVLGGEFGNAVLTRGRVIAAKVHPLPSVGEPRSLLEAIIEFDGNHLIFFATHLATWIETTGEITGGERYFPRLSVVGNSRAHVAYSSPAGSVSSGQLLFYLAIAAAEKELIIQNPYFLPDPDAIEALAAAVQRGVDVRVMLPSDDATDTPLVQHASHHHFGTLLKRGVKIYEYQKTLLHQKVMIVDGVWTTVGSTNFDDRSFELNDEISVGVIDPAIAAQLKAAFEDDLKHAVQRRYDEWSDRGLWHKFVDGLTYLANEQL